MTEARTQAPTHRKLQRARREGRVASSRELTAAGVLIAALATAWWGTPVVVERLGECFWLSFRAVRVQGDPQGLLESCARLTWGPLTAAAAVWVAAAAVVGGLQVGAVWSLRAVTPRWRGRRMAPETSGARQAVRGLKLLLQLAWLIALGAWALRAHAPSLARLSRARPAVVMETWAVFLGELCAGCVAGLLVLAALDLLYQRHRHHMDLRMSRSELRREQREEAGDPRGRARRKRLHGELIGSAASRSRF